MNPNLALALCASGVLLIAAEFLLPGRVLFAAVGGVLVALGVHHLLMHGVAPISASMLLAGFAIAALSGWGWLPAWTAILGFACMIAGAARLAPGVHPAAAFATMLPPGVALHWLLRIAARAVHNKTIFF